MSGNVLSSSFSVESFGRSCAELKGTGVIVEATNGRMQFDNTLETRMQRMWNAMRATVNHTLIGESIGET